jgi:hypothetical protein
MTPEIREAQLATLAGCIEYLSGQPKCQIAARKLMVKLRTERMKLDFNKAPGQGSLPASGKASTGPKPLKLLKIAAAGVLALCLFMFLIGFQAVVSGDYSQSHICKLYGFCDGGTQ